jgi:Tfp pilus assembly protein PilF
VKGGGKHSKKNKTSSQQPNPAASSDIPHQALTLLEQAASNYHQGNLTAAESLYRKAIRIAPGFAGAYNDLANLLQDMGKTKQAIVEYKKALKLAPQHPLLLNNLGNALQQTGDTEKAIEVLLQATQLEPGYGDAFNNLGNAYRDLDQLDNAVTAYQQAIMHNPDMAQIHSNLGAVLKEQGELDAAITSFRRALYLNPGLSETHNNLGHALYEQLKIDEAIASFRRALEINPENADAHFNLASALLLQGRYGEGWQHYAWRGKPENLTAAKLTLVSQLQKEKPFAGKTVFVRREQGLGDEIMFASCLPELIRDAQKVIVECEPRLVPIYRRSFPAATIQGQQQGHKRDLRTGIEPVNLQIQAGTLAACYRKSLEDFPQHEGYLQADPERVVYWQQQLQQLGPGMKIGISWRGGTRKTRMHSRSIDLEQWLPLLSMPDTHYINLQYTNVDQEMKDLQQRHGVDVHSWQEVIDDYDETAAMVTALDLVITVQTALLHLSGALGQTAWVMVPYVPEWRYGLQKDSMPWYPSVRLFRQAEAGNWSNVLGEVQQSLAAAKLSHENNC